jgi:hypothetical protein
MWESVVAAKAQTDGTEQETVFDSNAFFNNKSPIFI